MQQISDYKTEIEKKGAISIIPKGNSMWPFLKNGKQSVIIEKVSEKPCKYDVIMYSRPTGEMVLHRIIEVLDNSFVVSGDSHLTVEEVELSQVFGVMTGFFKKNQYLSAKDEKYLKSVEKWYSKKTARKIRIKLFYLGVRIKNAFKRMFKGKKKGKTNV